MNRVLQLLRTLFGRMLGRGRPQVLVLRRDAGAQRYCPTPNRQPQAHFNPAQYALQETFPSRHAAEEQMAFRAVNPEGLVMQQTEEWFREGNSMRTRVRRTMVVTCSGAIVSPEKLQGICWCGGYDDIIARCALCARALCRLHARTLAHPEGQLILCDQHYRQVLNQLNTWDALDRSRRRK
jgi:hypothetical protein